jgi:hypothetical protein
MSANCLKNLKVSQLLHLIVLSFNKIILNFALNYFESPFIKY